MMSEANDRIERLEREMRRLRGWILVLGIALATTFILGATQGTPDELTLRKLVIVDSDGKERIVAGTNSIGLVGLVYTDSDGKNRIGVGTASDGSASLIHYDRDEKMRIAAATFPDGYASLRQYGRNGETVWEKASE
jgi:hypothetical protein